MTETRPSASELRALNETIRIMAEIDDVIDQHGGWPGAFQTGADRDDA